ncbi:MAG: TetR/AcrR family transcriptional regulator [Rhodocyclaceae bacterium]
MQARPADTRSRLIEAAFAAFAGDGYRASVGRIAELAGVARQTLYNHFPAKEALFSEAIARAVHEVLISLDGDGDTRATLLRFAAAYRRRVLSAQGLAVLRTVVAEAPRFPDCARRFFREGPAATRRRLAAYLAAKMESGALRRDDPQFAAEMLTAMLGDYDRLRVLIDLQTKRSSEAKRCERVVDCFLRAYAPERNRDAR